MKGAQAEKFIDPSLSVLVQEGVSAVRTFTINKPVTDLFDSARSVSLLFSALRHLDSMQLITNGLEITEEVANTKIAWATKKETDVFAYGIIEFFPVSGLDRTEVRVSMKYDLSKGKLKQKWDKLFGEKLEEDIFEDLRHFKQLLETGEIPSTEGQPQGHCGRA
jgi:uncharacterized membrane protein